MTLTHWGRVTHICVSKHTIIGSDNGLSPGRRQAIIWTNAGILLIRTLGTNFSETLGEILSFSFSKMHLKTSSAKWRLLVLGLNELRNSRVLTLWCRGKMAANLQMTNSIAFSWTKYIVPWFKCHWNMFAWPYCKWSNINSDNRLAPLRRPAIIWANFMSELPIVSN